MVRLPTEALNRKGEIIEKICVFVINELKFQKIVPLQLTSDFLQDYGIYVQQKIEDEKLRNWSPAMD